MNVLSTTNAQFTRAADVKIPDIYFKRFKTGIEAVDELFGGAGFVPGFMVTLAASAGVGKSSFALQILEGLEKNGKSTAFISGEETTEQLSFSCKRLGVSAVKLANMVDVDEICEAVIANDLDFVVLDSYPTIQTKDRMNSHEREEYIINRLVTMAKEHEVCVLFILHCNKDGNYRGSTQLNHAVDCFCTIEKNPEDYNLRDIMVHKNRFGGCSATTLRFGANGFDFETVVEVDTIQQKSEAKKTSKSGQVLAVLDTPKTIGEIVTESGVSGPYLTSLLRDLTVQGTIEKTGKGASATFVKKA